MHAIAEASWNKASLCRAIDAISSRVGPTFHGRHPRAPPNLRTSLHDPAFVKRCGSGQKKLPFETRRICPVARSSARRLDLAARSFGLSFAVGAGQRIVYPVLSRVRGAGALEAPRIQKNGGSGDAVFGTRFTDKDDLKRCIDNPTGTPSNMGWSSGCRIVGGRPFAGMSNWVGATLTGEV